MKHLLAAIALGASFSAMAAELETKESTAGSFSLATINGDLPAVDPSVELGAMDLVIRQDDWRQFEAVSRELDAEMQEELSSVRQIYRDKSKVSAGYRIFTEIHIRKKIERPLSGPVSWPELLTATGTQAASVAKVGVQGKGAIKEGFSLRVDQFTLFGIRRGDEVEVLCFDFTRTPGLSEAEAQRFASFMEKYQLVVVHWPSASVIKDKRGLTNYLMQRREKKG